MAYATHRGEHDARELLVVQASKHIAEAVVVVLLLRCLVGAGLLLLLLGVGVMVHVLGGEVVELLLLHRLLGGAVVGGHGCGRRRRRLARGGLRHGAAECWSARPARRCSECLRCYATRRAGAGWTRASVPRACLRRSGLAGADDDDGRRLRSAVRQSGAVQQMQLS
jgi:hypothetical protein